MRKTKFVIVERGMGGLLNPPQDAEHSFSVSEQYLNGDEVSAYSLRAALEAPEVPAEIKGMVRALLDEHKGVMTEEWEHSIYNYMRGCYCHDGIDRNVSNCIIDSTNSRPAEHHLAYLLIKSFFPDYVPNLELIANNGDKGSWSQK